MTDRGLDAPFPHAGLLGRRARLVLDRHHFLAVAVPQVCDGFLPARQGGLPLGPLLLGPAVGLRLLPKGRRALAGALGLAQPAQLLLRFRNRPAFGRPAQGLFGLVPIDRETQREVAIHPRTMLAVLMLPVS